MDVLSCRAKFELLSTVRLLVVILTAGCMAGEGLHAAGDVSDRGQSAGVTLALVKGSTGANYSAAFRNQSAKPLFLVIGTIVANDKWLCPSNIKLLIVGPDGKARRSNSSFGCDRSGAMAGRMDPLIIPLAAGASYSLPVVDFKGASAGRYSVKAIYTGVPISLKSSNSDMQGLSLIHYWTGTIDSNTVAVEIR